MVLLNKTVQPLFVFLPSFPYFFGWQCNSDRHETRWPSLERLASSFHILLRFGMKAAVLFTDEPMGRSFRPS